MHETWPQYTLSLSHLNILGNSAPSEGILCVLQRSTFHPVFTPILLRKFDDMVQNISTKSEQAIDARNPPSFSNRREELEPGDITFALSILNKCIHVLLCRDRVLCQHLIPNCFVSLKTWRRMSRRKRNR